MAIDGPDRTVSEKVTRRGLLGAGVVGVAAGAAAVVGTGSGKASSPEPWLTGAVDRVEDDQVFYLKQANDNGPAVRVELAGGATVLRDGVATLTDFEPGEEVGAGGEWGEDGSYVAFTVESTYRLLDAEVQTVGSETLVTEDGAVVLSGSTIPRGGVGPQGQTVEATPLEDIESSDRVIVLGRRAPAGEQLQAVQVGTYQ